MIRMNPAHDTVNPPGQHVPKEWENVQHQEKSLQATIDYYKSTEQYKRGFDDGVAFATAQKLVKYDPFIMGEFGR